MAKTFKVLSALLSYPTAELKEAAPALKAALEAEALLPPRVAAMVVRLIDDLASRDLTDAQERYVFLFDRTRSLSLHLFEHVHGESRERGQAMVDLLALYERHGLFLTARELPDYLPLFLEFLSTQPVGEARALLAQPLHIVSALVDRLRKRDSVYEGAFRALEALAKDAGAADELVVLPEVAQDDPNDLAALDRAWEDEPVTFGPGTNGGAGGCGRASEMLARMGNNPAPPTPRPTKGESR
jgi:nitrate reductase delta subunit